MISVIRSKQSHREQRVKGCCVDAVVNTAIEACTICWHVYDVVWMYRHVPCSRELGDTMLSALPFWLGVRSNVLFPLTKSVWTAPSRVALDSRFFNASTNASRTAQPALCRHDPVAVSIVQHSLRCSTIGSEQPVRVGSGSRSRFEGPRTYSLVPSLSSVTVPLPFNPYRRMLQHHVMSILSP